MASPAVERPNVRKITDKSKAGPFTPPWLINQRVKRFNETCYLYNKDDKTPHDEYSEELPEEKFQKPNRKPETRRCGHTEKKDKRFIVRNLNESIKLNPYKCVDSGNGGFTDYMETTACKYLRMWYA